MELFSVWLEDHLENMIFQTFAENPGANVNKIVKLMREKGVNVGLGLVMHVVHKIRKDMKKWHRAFDKQLGEVPDAEPLRIPKARPYNAKFPSWQQYLTKKDVPAEYLSWLDPEETPFNTDFSHGTGGGRRIMRSPRGT